MGKLVSIVEEPQKLTLGVQITFAILTTVAVTLRLIARQTKGVGTQWDDYLIVVALVLCLGLIACDMISTLYGGVGLHAMEVVMTYGMDRLTVFLKVLIPIQILWATSLAATKLSILLFYCRVFPIRWVHITAKIFAVIIFLWCLTVILCSFLLCRPFAFNWDPTILDGHCGNRVLSYIMTGVINIITDLAVLCIPMPVIWGLQMRMANKIGLMAVFATGFFVFIVSIVRLKALLTIDYNDATYSVPSSLIWSMVEPSVGIILACVPIIKVLIPQVFRSVSGSKPSQSNPTHHSKKTNGSFQALDEYPLQPSSKTKYTYAAEREIITGDGDSLESGRKEVQREGPLERKRAKDGIVVTQQWDVR